MDAFNLYACFVAGIVLSVVVPVAARMVGAARTSFGHGLWSDALTKVWLFARPLLLLSAGSAILGIIVLVMYLSANPDANPEWNDAVLYGFGWDSTLQKVKSGLQDAPPKSPPGE